MPSDTPLPPWILANALQDRIHQPSGRLLASKKLEPFIRSAACVIERSNACPCGDVATDDGST